MSTNADVDKPLRIFLVRHGETAWTLSGRFTGTTDIALTGHGEVEAQSLAPVLGQIPFVHILSSPRLRARQTCELAGLSAPVVLDDLAEWDYGIYEGTHSMTIHKQRQGWNIFSDGCPEGEMPSDVVARADRLIAHLETLQGNVAVFSHGHFSRAIAVRWIGLPILQAHHFLLGTASVSILSLDARHGNVRVIELWNKSSATPE